jgi:hypothetical protein
MKTEVVKWIERKAGNEVIAVWLDKNGNEVDPKKAFYGGGVYIRNNTALTSLTIPNEVGGYVYINSNTALTSLTIPGEVGGDVYINNNTALTSLTIPGEVGGYVYINSNTALTSLTIPGEVGGNVDINNNTALTSLTMPGEVGGDVYINNNTALTSLTMPNEVGGNVDINNNTALTSYNKNTIINSERLKTNNHQASIKDLITAILLTKNILFADGIMSKIISQKNNVFKVRIYGKKEASYCVYRDGVFSHGKTVEEAIDSLRFKQSKRDVSEFKKWNKTKKRKTDEIIVSYRSITGACESGVRGFCETIGIDLEKEYSVNEIIALTRGRYGHEQFKNFEWMN